MSALIGKEEHQVSCPISGDSFPDSSSFKEIEGLKVCPRCQTDPTIKLQCKEFVQKATYEREQLAKAIQKNRDEQEREEIVSRTTTKGDSIHCYECGSSKQFVGKLTQHSNGHWYCEKCRNPSNRSAMGLVK